MFRRAAAIVVILSLLLPLVPGRAAAAPVEESVRMLPAALASQSGASSGAVGNLHLQDQGGAENDPSRYVLFKTPGVRYSGTRTYILPPEVPLATLSRLTISANYRGPVRSLQVWSWWLYDWRALKYVKVGDNRVAAAGSWSMLTFTVDQPQTYVGADGAIRLQLRSSNAGNNARLDYEAITAAYIPLNGGPSLGGCPLLPADNIWNTPVDHLPVHARSNAWVNSIGRTTGFHMDFGSGTWDGGPIGIPYNLVPAGQADVPVTFDEFGEESDPGPYPIPAAPLIEHGSDHHLLTVRQGDCVLSELYHAHREGAAWYAGSGAVWDLRSNALRPAGWTSADAAGLPILPGLVRYDEVASGEIQHALRFTASRTNSYIWPARHLTSGSPGVLTDTPPMGARFRLKADFDLSGYPPELQVLLQAMKTYGIILADNGSNWYVSGTPDERWDNDMLHLLDTLTGDDFEAVDASGLMVDPDSGQAR